MFKTAPFFLFLILLCTGTHAQTTYLPLNTEGYHILDRLETKAATLEHGLYLNVRPVSRKSAVSFLVQQQLLDSGRLSEIDRYNIEQNISISGEWTEDENGAIDSKKPVLRHFYKKQSDLVYVKSKNFFLSANPVISIQGDYVKSGVFKGRRLSSSRGFEVRGWLAKKIGFYSFFTDNQEQAPYYVGSWIERYQAVPGGDYYKNEGNHYDYILAKAYIDFAIIKDHLNLTFGYDKHFYGDGIRSLLLSDFAANATFLRLNTRIWKFNYQNLFLELVPNYQRQFRPNGQGDIRYPHKYAAIHHLSMNVTRWLNIGLFESVVFGGRDRYEFSYMIPVIFYRAAERQLGDPDNANIGLNFKAIAAKKLQFYGQFLIDDFKAKEAFAGKGYWSNKFAMQLGMKYFDALNVSNLDLQGEFNVVRPYTYAHYDSTANFSHYNQPMAHPLGSNFMEVIGQIKYQPMKDVFLSLKGIWYKQGIDTGNSNYGSNIFKDYYTATSMTGDPADYQYYHRLLSGVGVSGLTLNLNASIELKRNIFMDLGVIRRTYEYKTLIVPKEETNFVYFGIRA
ncbi:MAG: hypothetical protein EOP49_05570, partial [Sphingobacteriales bacterium]